LSFPVAMERASADHARHVIVSHPSSRRTRMRFPDTSQIASPRFAEPQAMRPPVGSKAATFHFQSGHLTRLSLLAFEEFTFHMIVKSSWQVTILSPSGDHAKQRIAGPWPSLRLSSAPLLASQTRNMPSSQPLAIRNPSGENAAHASRPLAPP